MKAQKRIGRRDLLKMSGVAAGAIIMAACQPKVVEKVVTQEVEKVVKETVVVEKEVEKVVKETVVVEKEKVIASEGRTNIVVTGRLGSEDTLWEDLKGQFYEENPGVQVEMLAFPGAFTDYLSKVQSLAAGGMLGDVLYTTTTTSLFDIVVHADIFAPLDELIAEQGLDPEEYFYPASLQVTNREGKQFGLPHYCHPSYWFLFYNPTLFEQEGIDPPDWEKDTLDTLVEKGIKLTKDTNGDGRIDQWGLMQPNLKNVAIQGVTRLFGGELLDDPLASKIFINSPEAKQGIKWLYDLMYTHKVSPTPVEAPQGADPLFKTSKLAMALGGYWMTNSWGDDFVKDFQAQMNMCPAGPKGDWWGTVHTDAWSLVKGSKYPQEAWKVLVYLSGPAAGITKGLKGGTPGCSPGAATDRAFAERMPRLRQWDSLQLYHVAMEKARGISLAGNFRNNELFTAYDQTLDLLWTGNQEPTDAFFDDLQKTCQDLLDQPKP